MARQARKKSRTGIYHIIWRGANRQEIFHEHEDRVKYLDILVNYQVKNHLTFYAWCLMDNHVHLLIREGNEDISATMKRIAVSYALYYNEKYDTTGHLFQDRFRSEVVESRCSFLKVVRYIHQNPLKAGMVRQADEWLWSSCRGYYGRSLYPQKLLKSGVALGLFDTNGIVAREKFREFNERENDDQCLGMGERKRGLRLTDEEAREKIKHMLGPLRIVDVKCMPREKRDRVLRKLKQIQGLSLRQAARILGVSATLILRA